MIACYLIWNLVAFCDSLKLLVVLTFLSLLLTSDSLAYSFFFFSSSSSSSSNYQEFALHNSCIVKSFKFPQSTQYGVHHLSFNLHAASYRKSSIRSGSMSTSIMMGEAAIRYKIPNDLVFPSWSSSSRSNAWNMYKAHKESQNASDLPENSLMTLNSSSLSSQHRADTQVTKNPARSLFNTISSLLCRKVESASREGVKLGSSLQDALTKHMSSQLKYLNVNFDEVAARGIVPVLVFVNKKSGGLQGQRALDNLRKDLHYIQVCDLTTQNPADYIEFYRRCPTDLSIVCCGGDGTVGWIMDEIKNSGLKQDGRKITFGIVPFGTGNDLFRHIHNFANNITDDVSPRALVANCTKVLDLYCAAEAKTMPLDRWSVLISPKPKLIKRLLFNAFSKPKVTTEINGINSEDSPDEGDDDDTDVRTGGLYKVKAKVADLFNGARKGNRNSSYSLSVHKINMMRKRKRNSGDSKAKSKLFNNYFGIGVDGAVTIAFDELRRQIPSMFFHKLINKAWYAIVGLTTYLFRRSKDLSKCVELRCDGIACPIPPGCQGLIFTNIDSYAGGSKLWQFEDIFPWKKQLAGDGIIEVIAVTGVPHLGKIKTGLANAFPVAQGQHFEFVCKQNLPMQMDGEPWYQRACRIELHAAERVDITIPERSSQN